MQEYHDQTDSCNVICPYCQNEYQPEAESYDEDSVVEECDNCGKKYHRYDSFSVDHNTRPDCALNGLEHQFVPAGSSKLKYMFCAICGSLSMTPE